MLRRCSIILLAFSVSAAHAATYTVGAGGTHATVQAAIDAALAASGSDEIRVAEGTFSEHLEFTPTGSGNILHISGGWNAGFTAQGEAPSAIDGGDSGRVFNINLGTGDGLTLSRLRIQNGKANPAAGLLINQSGDSFVIIDACEIVDNTADDDRSESAGLRVSVNDNATFTLEDSAVSNNQSLCSGTIDCREGGMGLQAANSAQVEILRNEFAGNSVVIASGSVLAGGASLSIGESATLLLEDNRFIGNTVSGTGGGGTGVGLGLSGDGTKTARRNRIENNTAALPNPAVVPQLSVFQGGDAASTLSDTVVVNSNTKGIVAITFGDGSPTLHLTNLTVADHAHTGIQAANNAAGGALNLSNSIAVNNGTDVSFSGGVTTTANLVGGAAGFVDAPGGDYSLAEGSDAIDAGTNAPPGGLGPTDIDGNARISGGTVDQGAFEFLSDTVFADSFESGGG
jgi:hypothetical protein